MFYGIYKNVRNASWKCLIDYKVSSMPVDALKIAKAAKIIVRKNSDVGILKGGESGKSILDTERGEWYIVFDDETSRARQRLIVAHELGHIFLGHDLIENSMHRTFQHTADFESHADAFAVRLLAPACVLWGLNLHTETEIAEVCGIPAPEAQKRAVRMNVLYKRQKFLTTSLETNVFEQFKEYIDNEKRLHGNG